MGSPVRPEELTDEMIEAEMRRAGSAVQWNPFDMAAWNHLEDCRIAVECCSSMHFAAARQRVCDAINARSTKDP